MTQAAEALPTGSGADDETSGTSAALPFEIEKFKTLSRRYRDVGALRDASLAMLNLSPIAWSLLVALYHYLWGATEAYPTQAKLVTWMGWSLRTVRDMTRELETADVIVVERRKRPRPLGGFKLYYKPGPALLEALLTLEARTVLRAKRLASPQQYKVPKICLREPIACGTERPAHAAPPADDLSPSPISSIFSSPAEVVAPSAESDEQEVLKVGGRAERPIGIERAEAPPVLIAEAPPPVAAAVVITDEDLELARELLAHHAQRRHPNAALRVVWSGEVLALVAGRVSELVGTREEKCAAGLAAVESAFKTSKDRAPTLGYIFRRQEHFLEHVRRGLEDKAREERRQAAQTARKRAEEERVTKLEGSSLSSEENSQAAAHAAELLSTLENENVPTSHEPPRRAPDIPRDAHEETLAELRALAVDHPHLRRLVGVKLNE